MRFKLREISYLFDGIAVGCFLFAMRIYSSDLSMFPNSSMFPPVLMTSLFQWAYIAFYGAFLISLGNIYQNRKKLKVFDYVAIIFPIILLIAIFVKEQFINNSYPYE